MVSCDVNELATPWVRTLQPYQPGKSIEALQRESGLSRVVKLASNENPLGPSPLALEAVRAQLPVISRYPDGNGTALKEALAKKLGIDVDGITLGNGSNDVLELITRAFVTPAHQVIFSEHAFAVYPMVTQAVGAEAVVTPARALGHDLAAMEAALSDRTRLVFIANPNNPTGTWLQGSALKAFIEALPREVLIVVDEAYCDYVDVVGYPRCASWVERNPNLIVTRTFSKAYGLAGLRVGYALSHPVVAELLNRVRQPFNVNSLALAAAQVALDDEAHIRQSIALNRAGMVQLTEGIGRLDLDYTPSVANFLCVDFKRPASPIYEALLRHGVIVRPVDNYGLENHLRVTVGQGHENAQFLAALKRVLGLTQ
ncbi:MAG: histidinol-phosphate transaminase [Gammaproteobacteria bacterium]|nr:histidinol-phosphate transaminase [Gammaproteobacteria bacterium]MCI0590400.1 histidinol-phosphate transaminase [Gammaproteobacteria bacterium]